MMLRALLFGVLAVVAGSPHAPALAADGPLRVGVVAFPASDGDPHRSVSVFSTYTWSPTFETLTTFQEDGTLVGELAVSWAQVSPKTWHFSLRPDVVFSNGRPFTAAAVVSSLNYLKTPHGLTSSLTRDLAVVDQAEVIDDLTVAVSTTRPSAILPRLMAALYIVEPQQWRELGPEGFAQDPIGSGPFTIEDWRGNRILYAANPTSWRPPQLASMEVLLLPEATTRLQALMTGGIDIGIGMGPDDIAPLESVGGYMHQRKPIDVMSLTLVIEDGRPANDLRVRRALNHAVNKDAITQVLLEGLTQPATQGAVRGLLGYNPNLDTFPYDPDKARALLKEAGYEDGFELDVEVIIGSNAGDAAIYQLIAANLAEVGVTLNVITIPTSQMVRVILQGQWRGDGFSQIFGAWPTFEPLRTIRLHSCLQPTPWYCDERITPTYKAALETPDLEERIRLTQDVLAFYHDQATAILLHEVPLMDGIGPRVVGYAPNKGKLNYETMTLK